MCKYDRLYPVISEWKKLVPEIRNSAPNSRKSLTSFIKGSGNPTFSFHNHINLKLLDEDLALLTWKKVNLGIIFKVLHIYL